MACIMLCAHEHDPNTLPCSFEERDHNGISEYLCAKLQVLASEVFVLSKIEGNTTAL